MENTDLIVTENDYLSLSKDWHFRVDGYMGTLYYYDPDTLIYHELPKERATALLLMDGKNTLGKIKEIMGYLFEALSEDDIKKHIESVIESSSDKNNPAGFINVSDAPLESHGYDITTELKKLVSASARDIENVRKGRLVAPLNLTMMPSNDCATDCIYCYAERKVIDKKDYLSIQRWLELVDEASSLGTELAVFSGGDPLTYPHIMDILERMIQKNFKFTLPTKTLITEERAQRMADIGMRKCWNQISIDGLNPDTLKKMVGVDHYDQRAFSSIRNLVAADLNVRANIVVTPINYLEVIELARKLHDLGVKKIGFAGYGRSYYRHDDRLFLNDDHINYMNDRVEVLKEEMKDIRITNSVGKRDFSDKTVEKSVDDWKGRAKCSGGRSSLVITPAGDITLCEQIPLSAPYIVGNVRNQSIQEIWNSPKMWDMVNMSNDKFAGTECDGCSDFDECQKVYGHCFRDALFTFGTIYTAPPACPKAPVGLRMQ